MDKRQKSLFETEPAPWDEDAAVDRVVVRVVLAEPPYGPLDYTVPDTLRDVLETGRRVRVPLGRGNRTVVGYAVSLVGQAERTATPASRYKDILSVVDERPLLSPAMLRLTEWMAEYYLCPWGQVLESVVPAGVRTQAGTREVFLLSVPNSVTARLTQLKLPRKQAEVLKILAASSRPLTWQQLAERAGCGRAPIRQLEEKALIHIERCRVMDHEVTSSAVAPTERLPLNERQQVALEAIRSALYARAFRTLLVHGVTGSGKTELYMQAIEEVVSFGRQAIVLVPEISLTPQTLARFRSRFERVAVLHSHLSPVDRHWQWRRIAAGEVQVVVGARSAVFAPTPHLGLIVLDEEHDASFKQETAPRYHARDVALQRARAEHVPVLLGSATPSLESWQHAREGTYQLVELPRRILDRPLPHVEIVDLRDEFLSRATRGAISRPLQLAISEALRERGQIILLLNRRGFATSIQCPACGEVVRCPNCDLSLTHHREGERAVCHYCDYEIAAPTACPACRFEGIRYAGIGTQRLEAEVRARFPQANVLRMDSDTMQKPGSHEAAFERFRAGEIQILVGTQMIAKGLDFPNVTIVGVVNADTALHFPDFRAAERTFQLVTQVAGRTGRGDRGGRVLVQTLSPEHPAIVAAMQHDFVAFANQELPVRQELGYPPFAALVRLIFRGTLEKATEAFADAVAVRLQSRIETAGNSVRLLGPAPAPIAKLRGFYRFHLLLMGADGPLVRELARDACDGISRGEDIQWMADVDPVDML
ncbi:MAG: primosomal protein N' [Pirellulaceae bacterium]